MISTDSLTIEGLKSLANNHRAFAGLSLRAEKSLGIEADEAREVSAEEWATVGFSIAEGKALVFILAQDGFDTMEMADRWIHLNKAAIARL